MQSAENQPNLYLQLKSLWHVFCNKTPIQKGCILLHEELRGSVKLQFLFLICKRRLFDADLHGYQNSEQSDMQRSKQWKENNDN